MGKDSALGGADAGQISEICALGGAARNSLLYTGSLLGRTYPPPAGVKAWHLQPPRSPPASRVQPLLGDLLSHP